MIVTLFLNFLFNFINGMINLLPTASVPTQWISAVYTVWQYGNVFSYVFPIQVLLFWLGIVMVFEVSMLTFKIFHWIITKLPGPSS